jgi:hypothetical protein
MFQLAINHGASVSVTTHPSREVAFTELLAYLVGADYQYRITQASWTHSSYELFSGPESQVPDELVRSCAGTAVIEEICGCGDAEDQHEQAGCAAIYIVEGRLVTCGCPGYQPVTGDPTLFDVAHPTQRVQHHGQIAK